MRIPKGLAFGLAGAFLVGGLEAVGGLAVEAVADSDADDVSVTVPYSKVGDRVLYVSSWRERETDAWKPGERMGFEVASRGLVPDKYGTLHDAVHVYFNNWSAAEQGGVLGREWRNEGHGFEDWSFTVADRTNVFNHYRGIFAWDYLFVQQTEEDAALGLYGPFDMGDVAGLPAGAVVKWDLALHQGATYGPASDLGAWALDRISSENGLSRDAERDAKATDLEFSAYGGAPATIGERVSLPLTLTGCVSWEKGPQPPPWYGGPPFLGFEMKPPGRVCFDYTEWVTGDLPYPVRIESRLLINQTGRLERIDELAAFVAGNETVEWGRGADPIPAPGLARGPTHQHFPADGTAPLAYPLGRALAAVEQDRALLQFQLWRAQHPDAVLTGAALRPTQLDSSQLQWDLVFGTPAGKAFVVSTQSAPTSGTITSVQMGELPSPPYDGEDMVEAPLTFGAAAMLWERYSLQAPVSLDETYVSWGFQYMPSTLRCVTSEDCGATPQWVRAPPLGLATIAYGQSERTTGAATSDDDFNPFNFIVVDARAGVVPVSYLTAAEYRLVPLSAPENAADEPATPNAIPTKPRTLDVRGGAAISASLILLVLVTYFYPVLKVAATQAGFLIPGYAKTEKSQLLNHKTRESLANAIRHDPGITPPQLQTLTGLAWSTVVYHLRQLEKTGLVTSLIDGRHKRFFPADTVNWSQRDRIAALANARTKQLYGVLLEEPGLDRHDLAKRVGISRPATYFHLERLERTGLVGRDTEGRRTRFFALAGPEVAKPLDPREAVEVA